MDDYIKLNRKIVEWEWYSDINTSRLFIHMLLKANWKEAKFHGTTVPRGSFVSSIGKLSDETCLTIREVRTAISHLKMTGEVTSKTTNKYTVFTVNNYDQYQLNDKQKDNQETNERQPNDNPTTTIEEYKEGKKERRKEDDITVSDDTVCQTEVRRVIEEWNRMGINRVSKITRESKRYKMISARIREYGAEDVIEAIRRIRKSTFLRGGGKNGWMIDFEWFSRPNNFPKVLEGKYDDRPDAGAGSEMEEWKNEHR